MKKYYWLNKNSRAFLKRGYLEDNESPEKRVADIAKSAEKYLKLKGFAEKFEDYVARGFYSLSSPVWANFWKEKRVTCFLQRSLYRRQDGLYFRETG